MVHVLIGIYNAAMLEQSKHIAGNHSVSQGFAPFKIVDGGLEVGLLLICDHASNALPTDYGTLGLGADQFQRHIAYDIGVADLVEKFATALKCPAVLSQFSRLLIDPNRGEDDPTLVMKLSDGAIIPGNRDVSLQEKNLRIRKFHAPYHEAIDQQIDHFLEFGKSPVILSIHSFTPVWRGLARIWSGAVLWDKDMRFAKPLITELGLEQGFVIGDNVPYSGRLKGDCLYQHGTKRGLAHALLEIRQDLISDDVGIDEWTDRLLRVVMNILRDVEDLHKIKHYGSFTD